MEIGISTAAFYANLLTEDALLRIGAMGTGMAEVFLDSYAEYTEDFGALLQRRAAQAGLRICAVHAMSMQFEPQLFSRSKRQREDAWRLYESVLATGRRLGAGIYVLHGQARMGGALRNPDIPGKAQTIADLADLAGSYGIKLCWENVSWCLFNHPGFARELVQAVPHENLGFVLDVKQAVRSGHSPYAYIDAMGARLFHVHLSDYTVQGGAARMVMPGRGTFGFSRFFAALRAAGYKGDAVFEPYSDVYDSIDEVQEAWAYLCRQLESKE